MSKPRQSKKQSQKESPSEQMCEMPGCPEHGEYRAPGAPNRLREYHWYCLDHIREVNKSWDFFKGMDRDEIEAYMKDAVTGHRPTWTREEVLSGREGRYWHMLQEELQKFMNPDADAPPKKKKYHTKEEKALVSLGLEKPYTQRDLKLKYRALVKLYHPDLHPGNKENEERFKEIAGAYHFLMQQAKES